MLGVWGSPASEGADYWLSMLTGLKNRGVQDVFVADVRRLEESAQRSESGLTDDNCADLRHAPDAWAPSNTHPRRTGTH